MQRDPLERTVEVAKAIARAEWPGVEADPDFRALGFDDAGGKHFRWKAWQAIEGLWALEDPKAVDVRATEHDVEADLGGVPFRGIVDRLDEEGDGLVTDYKSGKAPSARFRRGRLDQVLLYAAAVEQATGRCWRTPGCCTSASGLSASRSPAKRLTVLSTSSPAPGRRSTRRAIPTSSSPNGSMCGWCPYVDRCPEGTKEVAKRQAKKDADAAAMRGGDEWMVS